MKDELMTDYFTCQQYKSKGYYFYRNIGSAAELEPL